MIAGVLLAAGRSSRFGSDKLCSRFKGAPVIAWSVRALTPVDALFVVTPPDSAPITEALRGVAAHFVTNTDRDAGMSSSIRVGVAALPPDTEAVIIALGDQPLASEDVTRKLIAAWRAGESDIVIPVYTNARGHPVLFSRRCFDALRALTGDEGARSVTERPEFRVAQVPVAALSPLDVDTPEALALAARQASDDASISPPSV
jgi:molybdenum cofactor cytidylyltransferase